jgi:hypothetical protein
MTHKRVIHHHASANGMNVTSRSRTTSRDGDEHRVSHETHTNSPGADSTVSKKTTTTIDR